MYRVDIGVDLGTSKVAVFVRDKGIVINQPAVVAYERKTRKIIAVGSKAKKMTGKTGEDIVVETPIQRGVISQYFLAERMLKAFVKNALKKRHLIGRPNVCVAVPMNISEVEKRAVLDAVEKLGARGRRIIETPIAAAIGTGADIMLTTGHLVVDIGGGTTEIAIIASGDIAVGESVKIGGDDFTEALIRYVRRKYNVLLGWLSAEELKSEIGSIKTRDKEVFSDVKGRNLMTGLPERISITANETVEVFAELANQIAQKVLRVIDNAELELVSDLKNEGLLLSGGGALLYGMEEFLSEKTGLRAVLSDQPESIVAVGTGLAGEYIDMKISEEKRLSDLDEN